MDGPTTFCKWAEVAPDFSVGVFVSVKIALSGSARLAALEVAFVWLDMGIDMAAGGTGKLVWWLCEYSKQKKACIWE